MGGAEGSSLEDLAGSAKYGGSVLRAGLSSRTAEAHNETQYLPIICISAESAATQG